MYLNESIFTLFIHTYGKCIIRLASFYQDPFCEYLFSKRFHGTYYYLFIISTAEKKRKQKLITNIIFKTEDKYQKIQNFFILGKKKSVLPMLH